MPRISLLSQVFNAQDDTSDLELVALELEAESEGKFEMNEDTDPFSDLFGTKINKYWKPQKKDQHASQIDVAKRANLFNEIFNYIHMTRCRTLFSLAWYNDLIYA